MPTPRLENELAVFGAFFAVEVVDDDTSPGPGWQPLARLTTDGALLRSRVLAVREVLARTSGRRPAGVELRAAASTAQLGLVARLTAPVVAAAALGLERIDAATDALWWKDRLGAPFPLAVRTHTAAPDDALGLTGTAIEAITEAVAREFAVPDQVVWGNVGSAANSAARLVAEARPVLGPRAYAAADALLADPRVDRGGLRSGPGFRRRSCCLIYRLAREPSAVCEDCVLSR